MSTLALLLAGSVPTLDEQTVTVGSTSVGTDPVDIYAGFKDASPSFGSCADATSNLYGGAAIKALYFHEHATGVGGADAREVILIINGTQSNSGWNQVKIGTTIFTRSAASFSTAGGVSTWVWGLSIPNPFVSGAPGPFTPSPVDAIFT